MVSRSKRAMWPLVVASSQRSTLSSSSWARATARLSGSTWLVGWSVMWGKNSLRMGTAGAAAPNRAAANQIWRWGTAAKPNSPSKRGNSPKVGGRMETSPGVGKANTPLGRSVSRGASLANNCQPCVMRFKPVVVLPLPDPPMSKMPCSACHAAPNA